MTCTQNVVLTSVREYMLEARNLKVVTAVLFAIIST